MAAPVGKVQEAEKWSEKKNIFPVFQFYIIRPKGKKIQ
jgi:hypothetical protein